MKQYRNPAILIVALLACVSLVCAHDEHDDANDKPAASKPPVITLLEAGEEPRVKLRLRPTKGATEESEMRMQMTMQQGVGEMMMPEMRMPEMRLTMVTTIDDVSENGDTTFNSVFIKAEVADEPGTNPMVLRQMQDSIRSLQGMVTRGVMSDRGILQNTEMEFPAGMDRMVRQQMEGVVGSIEQFATPLPEEAVGVGGKWQVDTTMETNGMTLQQTAIFTLKSLDGDTVELHMENTQTADPQKVENPMLPPNATMQVISHDAEGKGEIKMHLSRAMTAQARSSVESMSAFTMTMGEQAQDMKQRMQMRMSMASVSVVQSDEE